MREKTFLRCELCAEQNDATKLIAIFVAGLNVEDSKRQLTLLRVNSRAKYQSLIQTERRRLARNSATQGSKQE